MNKIKINGKLVINIYELILMIELLLIIIKKKMIKLIMKLD